MFCKKCGCQIDDDSKFCPSCGAVLSGTESLDKPPYPPQAQPQAQPQTQPQIQPMAPAAAPKKNNKGLIIAIIAVAVVAVIAIVAVVILSGGKSKNDKGSSAPMTNAAPVTQAQNDETTTKKTSNTSSSYEWYDGVWKDGDLTFKVPCNFREFFDAAQTTDVEEYEEYFDSLTLADIGSKTDYVSDNYDKDDFKGTIYFDTNGATNMWDTKIDAFVVYGLSDKKYDLVRLEPGIYVGMSKDEAVEVIGEPDEIKEYDNGISDYTYRHGDMELILYLDKDGTVDKIGLWYGY